MILDQETFRPVDVNTRAALLLGYESEKLLNSVGKSPQACETSNFVETSIIQSLSSSHRSDSLDNLLPVID